MNKKKTKKKKKDNILIILPPEQFLDGTSLNIRIERGQLYSSGKFNWLDHIIPYFKATVIP